MRFFKPTEMLQLSKACDFDQISESHINSIGKTQVKPKSSRKNEIEQGPFTSNQLRKKVTFANSNFSIDDSISAMTK